MSQNKKQILQYIQYFFAATILFEDVIEFLAFGIRREYKKLFIFKCLVIAYSIVYIIVEECVEMHKFDKRMLGGLFIAVQFIRYLACKLFDYF